MRSIKIADVVRQMYAETDKTLESVSQAMGVTCRKGCDHCCYLLAVIGLSDSITICDELMKDDGWRKWLPRIAASARLMLLNGKSQPQWFKAHIPCVFLDAETRLCEIYPVRPVACRTHLAVSPPENCGHLAIDTRTKTLNLAKMEARFWELDNAISTMPLGGPIPIMLFEVFRKMLEGNEEGLRLIEREEHGVQSPMEWAMANATTFSGDMMKDYTPEQKEELTRLAINSLKRG